MDQVAAFPAHQSSSQAYTHTAAWRSRPRWHCRYCRCRHSHAAPAGAPPACASLRRPRRQQGRPPRGRRRRPSCAASAGRRHWRRPCPSAGDGDTHRHLIYLLSGPSNRSRRQPSMPAALPWPSGTPPAAAASRGRPPPLPHAPPPPRTPPPPPHPPRPSRPPPPPRSRTSPAPRPRRTLPPPALPDAVARPSAPSWARASASPPCSSGGAPWALCALYDGKALQFPALNLLPSKATTYAAAPSAAVPPGSPSPRRRRRHRCRGALQAPPAPPRRWGPGSSTGGPFRSGAGRRGSPSCVVGFSMGSISIRTIRWLVGVLQSRDAPQRACHLYI